MKSKSVDINQRIPLEILAVALHGYLTSNYNENYMLEQLRLEFKGENRIRKALRIIGKIITDNPMQKMLQEKNEEILLALKKKDDRNLILISLLNAAFPFSFHVLQIFGKYLAVQEMVSTETVLRTLSASYGGNRATENGLYSVVPMFIQAGLLRRPKIGLYVLNESFTPGSDIAAKLFEESFVSVNRITDLHERSVMDPYFIYIKP
ncbi:hypothetical protein [Kaistella sp.]|uniref:hypothetical protein n=1 Tax=Kaistella sp. TaxID=2782235 RepID=UPI002F91D89E